MQRIKPQDTNNEEVEEHIIILLGSPNHGKLLFFTEPTAIDGLPPIAHLWDSFHLI